MEVEHLLGRLAPWHDLFVESRVRGAAVVDVLHVTGATQSSHSHVYVHTYMSCSAVAHAVCVNAAALYSVTLILQRNATLTCV